MMIWVATKVSSGIVRPLVVDILNKASHVGVWEVVVDSNDASS